MGTLPWGGGGCDKAAMLAIDWGLSSFRAWRLGADGAVLDRLAAAEGIRSVPAGGFAAALETQLAPWGAAVAEPALLCGMVGSRQGWVEAPYAPCPARAEDIAARLSPLPGRPGSFVVPGLSFRDGGVADVMRGEETQTLGVLPALGPGRHTLCLPGTHSKWVTVEDGAIVSFRTAMTGELFSLLTTASTLAPVMERVMEGDGESGPAFDAGQDRAAAPGGLTHHLFGLRAGVLLGTVPAAEARERLSGLLIGHEVAALGNGAGRVHLVGAPSLTARYARALGRRGVSVSVHGEDSAARGLAVIAAARGLL